jgi:hypothetical protein
MLSLQHSTKQSTHQKSPSRYKLSSRRKFYPLSGSGPLVLVSTEISKPKKGKGDFSPINHRISFYTVVFRQDVLWYSDVCKYICPSFHPSVWHFHLIISFFIHIKEAGNLLCSLSVGISRLW